MRKLLFLSLCSLLTSGAFAQNELLEDKKVKSFVESARKGGLAISDSAFWSTGGNFGLQFSQASYTNWQAGGVNSVTGNSLLNLFANYQGKGKWSWVNSLILAYGLNYQDSIFNKTDDRIELQSRVDYVASKKVSYSALLNFRTQFQPGFKNSGETADSLRVSNFMAPAYTLLGIGATYKPNKKWALFVSPITLKSTFVLDERLSNAGAFGVNPGEPYRAEAGGYINLTWNEELGKNVSLQFRADLFSNYLENPGNVDINSELLLFFKVNEWLSANLALAYVYDDDVRFDVDGKTGVPRSQFRQIFGFGLSYKFGAAKE